MMMMETGELPQELSQLCLARLGLPFFLLDANESLVFANDAAYRVHPKLAQLHQDSTPPLHKPLRDRDLTASDLFLYSSFNIFDWATTRLHREGQHTFSLATIFSECSGNGIAFQQAARNGGAAAAHSPLGERDWDDYHEQAKECQPNLRFSIAPVEDARTEADDVWWKASISNFALASERSFYYAVLLLHPVTDHGYQAVTAPGQKSDTSILERPPLKRLQSDPPFVPDDIPKLTAAVSGPEPGRDLVPEFYKAAVENIPQIMFTSGRDGVVTYLNPQWYAYTGWPTGVDSAELWANVIYPADVDQSVTQYAAAVREGRNIKLQYRVRGADGTFRWMMARGRCIREEQTGKVTGFVCTLTDAQDLIDARQQAIQGRQYISTVLKSSGLALVVVDIKGSVSMYEGNLPALDAMGVSVENVLQQPFEEIWPHQDGIEQVKALFAAATSTTAPVHEKEFSATFSGYHIRFRLSPIYETPDPTGAPVVAAVAIVCTDITAMVNAEIALKRGQEERAALVASETAAKETARVRMLFVTSLSHEIRTPISGIIGISELLLSDEALNAGQKSLVEKQLQAGEMLLQLVSMVLDIGKMEANKLELETQPFRLQDLMRNLDIFDNLAGAKNIYFKRNIDELLSRETVLGDKLRLAQILSNFISNAIKFTSSGGVTLSIAKDPTNDQFLLFEIVDTGVGIDEVTLPQLFKPFHQGHASVARQYGGSGLGLTIAKSLTELMNGQVSLSSTVSVGTAVRLQIPLPRAQAVEALPSRRGVFNNTMQETFNRSKYRILIVEDNKLLQDIYSALVARMGFSQIAVAGDGEEALRCIEAAPYDLVLMDVELPKMTGPEAVALIRRHPHPAIRNLKIVALTANAIAGDEQRFLSIGFDLYLSKPVRATTLETAIMSSIRA